MSDGTEGDAPHGGGFLAALRGDLRARSAGPLLALAVVALFALESGGPKPQYDDAYISYRYARNWVAGEGLVYNPGERVEGFSNPLWTLLVAAGLALGADAVPTGHALGLASGALCLIATFAWARARLTREHALFAGVAAALVWVSPAFAQWSISGMETPLFAACTTGALAALAWRRLGLATACALAASLTRPEGPLLAACVLGFAAFDGTPRRRVATALALYAGAMGVALALRLAYYDALLPNTFYAKVDELPSGRSAALLGLFLLENGGALAPLAALASLRDRRLWPGAAFALALAGWGFTVGSGGRYLVPLVPCLAVLGSLGAAALFERGARRTAVGALVLTCACSGLGLPGLRALLSGASPLAHAARSAGLAQTRVEYGRAEALARRRTRILAQRDARDVLVATGAIGSFGFYSGAPILDILGLVDPVIARSRAGAGSEALAGHQRSDPDYVFSRAPDYILIAREAREGFGALVPAPEALRRHPALARDYRWDARIVGFRRVRSVPGTAPRAAGDAGFDRPGGHR